MADHDMPPAGVPTPTVEGMARVQDVLSMVQYHTGNGVLRQFPHGGITV